MREIVLDERALVEHTLENHILGRRPSETISRVAKYYYNAGYKKSDIVGLLEDFMLRCDPSISIVKWWKVIEYHAKNADKYDLIDIHGIKITDSEIMSIGRLTGVSSQRLMFTLLCLAKYGDAINPKNNGWVNRKDTEIFGLANIKISKNRQALMINDLWCLGYIGYSRLIDNTNINVKIVDRYDSNTTLMITDFRNLGYQWMYFIGDGCIECQNCGLVVRKSNNSQKCCVGCSEEINRQRSLDRRRNIIIA